MNDIIKIPTTMQRAAAFAKMPSLGAAILVTWGIRFLLILVKADLHNDMIWSPKYRTLVERLGGADRGKQRTIHNED